MYSMELSIREYYTISKRKFCQISTDYISHSSHTKSLSLDISLSQKIILADIPHNANQPTSLDLRKMRLTRYCMRVEYSCSHDASLLALPIAFRPYVCNTVRLHNIPSRLLRRVAATHSLTHITMVDRYNYRVVSSFRLAWIYRHASRVDSIIYLDTSLVISDY